ncbi:hypothetical protein [Candidatus Nanohalobium constans]|nr:hypothetical protein [Candidatus Nanohalobium constans]
MDLYKIGVLLLSVVLLAGFSIGFTGSTGSYDGGSGSGGDDDFGDGGDVPGDGNSGSDDPSLSPGSCYNDADDDSSGVSDLGDVGCVGPKGFDEIEGNIWDSDLTTTLSGEDPSLSEDESVFFGGSVFTGNDYSPSERSDSRDGSGVVERFIVDMGSEVGTSFGNADNQFYAYGRSGQKEHSGFPEGTVLLSDRVIDSPNPGIGISGVDSGDIVGSEDRCGDGYETDALSKSGDDGVSSATTDCRADNGRVKEKYGVSESSSYEEEQEDGDQSGSQTDGGLYCRDDNEDSSGNDLGLTCTDGEDATCDDGASICGCSASSSTNSPDDAVCDTAEDHSGDEGNDYWYIQGESLIKDSCEVVQSDVTYAEGSKGSSATCTDYSQVTQGGSCMTCSTAGSTTYPGGEGAEVTGDNRDWVKDNSENCNVYNVVDGGGESGGSDEALSKPDNDAAATFTDFEAHEDSSWGSDGRVWCGYESTLTVDADGPQGNGDGFAVIHDGSVVATESPDGSDSVGQSVFVSDGSTSSTGRDYTDMIENEFSCDNGKSSCLVYVDFQTSDSGWSTHTQSRDNAIDDAVEIDTSESSLLTADESYSVCKNINRINEKNGNGQDELIDCDYESNRDSGSSYSSDHDVSPLPEACGDEESEHLIQFEGTEVDEDDVQNTKSTSSQVNGDLAFAQKCVDWGEDTGGFGNSLSADACVRNGTAYSEGTVINVARGGVETDYEEGGDSPDWEVCADIGDNGDEGDDLPWDNGEDNDQSAKDYGGEWYDLDSQKVQDYVRSNTGILQDDSNDLGSNGDPHRLSFYWRENPNPYHSDYNPQGGKAGTALEDDCGPNVDCNDEELQSSSNPSFFNFLNDPEGTRDEDFSPQGGSTEGGIYEADSFFNPPGRLNKLQEDTDQLEPGMDTTFPLLSEIDKWSDSIGGRDEADMFALTESLSWSISNRGVPYSPGSAPYHKDYSGSERSDPQDSSVSKEDKVFGNSLAVVAARDFNPEDGPEQIENGEGYWIEPDDIRSEEGNYQGSWESVLNYDLDITGPDGGLGFHTDGKTSIDTFSGGSIVNTDIFFEGEPSTGDATADNTNEYLEPPMCGDDQREYLLEERGEVVNSDKYEGRFACADARNHCVQRDYSKKLYDTGEYQQANEEAENRGRAKLDDEICAERPSDEFPNWYDQDFGDIDGDGEQDTCKVNNLYGDLGKRWFDKEDVEEHPNAFTGGIDDDSNNKLENQGEADLTSKPEASSWSEDETPVSSGEINTDRSVVTKGFCGGDDESEYIVTQTCDSRLCSTDNDVIGVAEDPDNCILDRAEVEGVSGSERMLYDEGETVEVSTGSDTQELACYGSTWTEKWPVNFARDNVTVPLNTTGRVSFEVINVRDDASTFDLELSIPNGDLEDLTVFEETGTNEMTVDVAGGASETHALNIRGNKRIENWEEIELQADSRDGQLSGYDTTFAKITETAGTGNGSTPTQVNRDVPGLQTIQLIWMAMIASTIYFLTAGRNL